MKKKLILSLLVFTIFFGKSFAQIDQSPEVGVIEHLGKRIPLDLKFVNDNSDTVTLKQLINKPTILSFVYFDCPGLCSPLLEGVGSVIQKSDLELGKDYQVITISFNFRDTPEKAKKKKTKFVERYSKGKGNGWIFLTTDSTTIFDITDATGFKTKAVGLDFVHPSAIIAVSPDGMITRYLYGITFPSIDFKMAIIEAGKNQPRPSIQKALLFCYSYDQENKRYSLDVIKIAGTIIVFFILVFIIIFLVKPKKKNQNLSNDE
ncbi:MAG: SCO family protein [Bacteroidetes bacterium]|nr:SCO family protein [Bacteroidota bacterium]